MAEKTVEQILEGAPAPVEETKSEETTSEEKTPTDEKTPEADTTTLTDPAEVMAELLEEDGDDLDEEIPAEEKPVEEKPSEEKPPEAPPEGQEPPKKEEKKPDEAPPSESPTPPVVPSKEEAPKPAEAPAPEQAPPVPPAETPPVAAAPEPTPPTMEEYREQYQTARADLEKNVAQVHYKLSDEQMERLDNPDEAGNVISELLAKVYMDAITGSVAHMITHLPTMIDATLQNRDANVAFEKQFYDAHPQLNPVEHNETVSKLGAVYRQVNPTATTADFIRDVGASVLVALGVPPNPISEQPPTGGNGGQPPTPAAPTTAPQTTPFQPAGTGSGGGAIAQKTNPFEALAEEMAESELDLD